MGRPTCLRSLGEKSYWYAIIANYYSSYSYSQLEFTLLERRGERKDGRVWRCKSKQTASVYALKVLPNTVPQNAQGIRIRKLE